jgi:transposase
MTKRPANVVQQIKKATRKRFSADEKIRIVLEGLRGQIPISELCRREGISAATYHKWAKDFLEAGKNGLTLETRRSATSEEVKQLRAQNDGLKQALAEATLEVIKYKKSLGL